MLKDDLKADSGGLSPNVVQARAEVLYLIRAARNEDAAALYARVCDIARGAALMTGCEVEIRFDKACSNLMQNTALNRVMYAEMQQLGNLPVGAREREDASQHHATLPDCGVAEAGRSLASVLRGKPPALFDGLRPFDPNDSELLYGSTDVGDVSWITPTAQCWVACYALGTLFHPWQMVSQGGFWHRNAEVLGCAPASSNSNLSRKYPDRCTPTIPFRPNAFVPLSLLDHVIFGRADCRESALPRGV
ncbi:hypothetical protein J8I82_21445 [Cupriavidus sp. LEh25]|nr:hypothetical protein [Cupriavidus sp. LEh25]